MATDLATAYVQLIPSASGIGAGIEKELTAASGPAAKTAGSKIGSVLKSSAVTAIGGVTTAAVGMTAAFVKSAASTASYGDNIDKMSQKMGLSAEAYQEWDAIMQHCGTSIDAMQPSMKTLATAAESGSEAFAKLGMSQSEIANMSQEELFAATISALQNVESETERTYLAGQLLGRGATELGALLNTSAEDTEAMRQRVHELGGVMSNEAVAASAAYQDSLQDMQTAFHGISLNMVSEFLPAITGIMDGLTEMFSGDSETGIAMVTAGISDFLGRMTEAIPEVISMGSQLVTSLLTAILENLPSIVTAGTEAIHSLCTGLASSLPTLIPMAAKAITSLVTGLLDNAPALIDSALVLIQGLASGLLSAIPVLLQSIPQIIQSLVGALGQGVARFVEIGGDLVKGLWQGIQNFGGWLWDQVTGFFGGIWNGICGIFGINSPSKKMAWVGEMMDRGAGQGIDKYAYVAVNATKDMARQISDVGFGVDTSGIRGAVSAITRDAAGVVRSDVAIAARGGAQPGESADVLTQILQALLALSDKIDRLQIVLNTGALVGGLLDPLNEAMGVKNTMGARGAA